MSRLIVSFLAKYKDMGKQKNVSGERHLTDPVRKEDSLRGTVRGTIADGSIESRIGANMKISRLSAGLTQTELAKKIGVTHSAISYWENGVNIPNVADCIKIADVLNVSLDELVGRDFRERIS